jgi:hypothetical protein
MKHVPSLDADFLPSYAEAKIKVECLFIIEDKISKLESLGLKEGLGDQLTVNHKVNQTRDLISLIRAHISSSVSFHILAFIFMPTITFRQG